MASSLRNYHFEDYLRDTNKAETVEELFEIYLRTVKRHGLDRAIFSLITDHGTIGEKADFGMFHNYPKDWLQYYIEKDFKYVDPVMLYAAVQVNSFKWADIPTRIVINKKQELCLQLGAEAGLHNGVCSPFRGPRNELAGVALATTEKQDAFDGNVDLINAYSHHFYTVYRKLCNPQRHSDQTDSTFLTDREREILRLVALGKTNGEIADIIYLSEATVDFHLRKVYKKLNANSRIYAAVKAISMGLVHF